ncbi:hypothetical protein C2S53_015190 [Perilla frutescens var. hirtella]|uniref:Transposase MuDR plant domain-containing protein n=1 Tax=Perilla frutescens var. hirtella TaxID=608512 RepID=A0AAD4J633_PERFH|nr:hypothetical protein C2S53_015190 [Perilla frutescens var. hirtella]
MERKAEFKVPRSCGSRVEYTCKRNPSCTFELRASWRRSYWIVHKFNMQHTCNLDLGSVGVRNVRAKAVAAYYARKMHREERIMKPREIMAELLHKFGVRASYQVALRARNAAISMIYGGHVYKKAIEAIGKSRPRAWNKLMAAKSERWARSQCHVSRFSFPTSNIAESFNSRLLFARRLPIISTIEAIRHVMEE